MKTVNIIKHHRSSKEAPLKASSGEQFNVGKKETRLDWSGWYFCKNSEGRSGWVSKSFFDLTDSVATFNKDYDATEVDCSIGDTFNVEFEDNGWLFGSSKGKTGWVPSCTTDFIEDNELVQSASIHDCEQILEIYSYYIKNTAITFEESVPSIEAFRERFNTVSSAYPWLVYKVDGNIMGYAYASMHRSRSAYKNSCETTLYVDRKYSGKGVGSQLYKKLLLELKTKGYMCLLAGITQPNIAGTKIHEDFGFKKIGTFNNIGFKFNKWQDVTWYQLLNTDSYTKKSE